jgi:hypothetical protein
MEWKSTALTSELTAPPLFDPLIRRFTGDGLPNLIAARAEVLAALREGDGVLTDAAPCEDTLPASAIPSLAKSGLLEDRVLAEIDHDGFAFAADPADKAFFNRREERHARHHNLLDIVLLDGRVCVRKRFRRARFGVKRWGGKQVPFRHWAMRCFWVATGLFFYNEAAALLRLRDLPFVPKLRRIDIAGQALFVDYLGGESLRHKAASTGQAVHDLDLALSNGGGLSHLTGREMERREVTLYDSTNPGDYRGEIASMSQQINDRGVAPLDIKLGNFIRGSASGQLYWIDFEISRIASQPRWMADLLLERELLDYLFELTARGYQF